MTKKEESPQSLSISFKLKLIRKNDSPSDLEKAFRELHDSLCDENKRLSQGVYSQVKTRNTVQYNRGNFSIKQMEELFADLFDKNIKK